MKEAVYKISLDLAHAICPVAIPIKTGDNSRKIVMSLSVGSEPWLIESDCTAIVYAKVGKNVVTKTATVENGSAWFVVPSAWTNATGQIKCELRIFGNDGFKILTSPEFSIYSVGAISPVESNTFEVTGIDYVVYGYAPSTISFRWNLRSVPSTMSILKNGNVVYTFTDPIETGTVTLTNSEALPSATADTTYTLSYTESGVQMGIQLVVPIEFGIYMGRGSSAPAINAMMRVESESKKANIQGQFSSDTDGYFWIYIPQDIVPSAGLDFYLAGPAASPMTLVGTQTMILPRTETDYPVSVYRSGTQSDEDIKYIIKEA